LEEAYIEPDAQLSPEENAARLARLATILQLSSEYQAMRAEDLQAASAKKDQELDLLDEQLEAMEQRGGRSDARLEQEAEAARTRAEELERRFAEQREEVEVLKEQLDRTKREIRDEKRRTDDATKSAKAAEDDLKELQEQLSAERQKSSAKQRDESTNNSRMAQRNQEVARYQKENRLVAEENERLNGRIEELMSECVQYSESIVKLDDAAQAWRGREADVEAAADGLRRERDKLAAQLETTRVDLEERTGLLQDFENKFSAEFTRWEKEKQELTQEAKRLRSSATVEGVRGSYGGAGSHSPRRQLALRDPSRDPNRPPPNPDDPGYVEELEAEVAELRDLRVLLLEAYDQLEQDVGREVDIALRRQQRHTANLESKVSSQDEALSQEGKRFKALDRGLTEAQEDLAEATSRMAQYEAGVYGLTEAMCDLKQLRLQVRAADQQVEEAVATSNGGGCTSLKSSYDPQL
jgi:centrosomal protein CEP290